MIWWTLIFGFVIFIDFTNSEYTYEVKYLDVPLNHFAPADDTTFSIRYLINDSFWKPLDGPIFLYAGNEGDINLFAQNTVICLNLGIKECQEFFAFHFKMAISTDAISQVGFQWEIAKRFGALIVFGEHRYCGKSMPPGSKNDPQYYHHLSSSQVLADYVDLIDALKNHKKSAEEYHNREKVQNLTRSNPVIVFGGSYGGMLAAWMRMKYPAVVEGALASSAPIFQFTGMTPCEDFYKVLTNAYKSSSPRCAENIRKSWEVLRKRLSTGNGRLWINSRWKLCKPIKTTEDVNKLVDIVSSAFVAVGMVNYPYPTGFLMPLPGNPVNEMCKKLNTPSPTDDKLLISVHEAISIYYNYSGRTSCLDWSASAYGDDLAMNTWNIQACTEMVMPMCTNGKTDMFEPSVWNLTQVAQDCYKDYRVIPNQRYVEKEYGGKDLRYTSNIIFSNGMLDPWSSGGVTENISPSNIVLTLKDSAHHLDLRASHALDPPSVVKARKLYINIFRRWIRNYHKQKK